MFGPRPSRPVRRFLLQASSSPKPGRCRVRGRLRPHVRVRCEEGLRITRNFERQIARLDARIGHKSAAAAAKASLSASFAGASAPASSVDVTGPALEVRLVVPVDRAVARLLCWFKARARSSCWVGTGGDGGRLRPSTVV